MSCVVRGMHFWHHHPCYTDRLNTVTMDTCMRIYYAAYMPDKRRFSLHTRAGFNYWSTMSVTFFGYGDIVFVRFEEYIFGIFPCFSLYIYAASM